MAELAARYASDDELDQWLVWARTRILAGCRIIRTTEDENLLVDQAKLSKMWVLRRILMQMGTVDAMQFLLDKMKDAKSNEDFFASMNQ